MTRWIAIGFALVAWTEVARAEEPVAKIAPDAAESAAETADATADEKAVEEAAEKAAEQAAPKAEEGEKVVSGMSIVGNDEAPKSLVIVPWKSSSLGDALDVDRNLEDGRGPVDRDVFRRQLDYYRIRSASARSGGAEGK